MIGNTKLIDGPAAARLVNVFNATLDLATAQAKAATLLDVMEATLKGHSFLVDNDRSLADIAMYAYVAHAPEGGVSLAPYTEVRAWLSRVEALSGFVPMQITRVALAA